MVNTSDLSAPSSAGAPDHLRVQLLSQPYGIETRRPLFSWADPNTRDDTVQSAYRIVFADRLHVLEHEDYLFDSGWITSSRNTAVAVDAAAVLQENALYYWQVQIRDGEGKASAFSSPRAFTTAIGSEWESTRGIWAKSIAPTSLNRFAFFRTHFTVDTASVAKVILSATGRGNELALAQMFDISVNASSVGLGPGRADHCVPDRDGELSSERYYNTYDITPYLRNGVNALAVVATAASGTDQAFLAQVTAFYQDGRKELLTSTSDGTWKAIDGSTAFGDSSPESDIDTTYVRFPRENIDMNAYPSDWQETAFDDSSWPEAVLQGDLVDGKRVTLVPFPSENTLRVIPDLLPVVQKRKDGHWFIDLQKEIIGGMTVQIQSPKAQKITVYAGEQLNPDGSVRHHLASFPDYYETWTLIPGLNHFQTVTMWNFRYIEISGFDGVLQPESIRGYAMQQPFDSARSAFTSSNTLLNREYELSKYTIQATNQDLFVDSQARERRAYEGDLLVNGNTSYSVSDNYSLARHSISYLINNQTQYLDYRLFVVEMAWQDYLYTDDDTLLRTRYDQLKTKMYQGKDGADNYDSAKGLVTGMPLIDWPVVERDGFVEDMYNQPFNAIYVGAYSTMAKIAHLVGNAEDEALFAHRAATIKKNLIDQFYDSESGQFYDSMRADRTINRHTALHSTIYALAYGVYTDAAMAKKMAVRVANQGLFKGSIYMTYFILCALYNVNEDNAAATLLTNPDAEQPKTYAAVLDRLQATIAPEAWNNELKPNLTLSHPWGATPGLAIAQGMFGIVPLEAGFDIFAITVHPGGISSASIRVPTLKGEIKASYAQASTANMTVEVSIPANTRARVSVPFAAFSKGDALIVNGQKKAAIRKNRYLSVELGSGQYKLEPVSHA